MRSAEFREHFTNGNARLSELPVLDKSAYTLVHLSCLATYLHNKKTL